MLPPFRLTQHRRPRAHKRAVKQAQKDRVRVFLAEVDKAMADGDQCVAYKTLQLLRLYFSPASSAFDGTAAATSCSRPAQAHPIHQAGKGSSCWVCTGSRMQTIQLRGGGGHVKLKPGRPPDRPGNLRPLGFLTGRLRSCRRGTRRFVALLGGEP